MTAIVTVRNRNGGDTYYARCEGNAASSTSGHQAAAHAVARKVAAGRPLTLTRVTDETWIAEIVDPSDASQA